MRKIIWVADFKQEEGPGGAQITNRTMVEYGRSIGYDITELSFKDLADPKNQRINKGNFYILNNYIHIYKLYPDWLSRLVKTVDFSRYIHDYDWLYPDLSDQFINEVFSRAKSVIYLSPLHKQQNEIKQFRHQNTIIIPSPVDTNYFYPRGVPRINNTIIYSGEINTHKGLNHIYNYALFNPEQFIDVYGWVAHPNLAVGLPSNVRLVGRKENSDMAEVYSAYQSVIHLPTWFEPFGRSVAEAYLCGCKLIVNEKVGFMSFKWNYNDRHAVAESISEAPRLFWEHIQEQL